MIGRNTDAALALKAAMASLDFTASNAELARLDAEAANLNSKAAEAEAEADRLGRAIRDWTGPDVDAIAEAILDGAEAREAALAAPSREALVEQRQTLQSTAANMRERASRAWREREDVARGQCAAILDAMGPFLAATIAEQRRAGQVILDGDAVIQAVAAMTGLRVDGEWPSRKAREALTKVDGLIGPASRLPVDPEVIAALAPVADRAKGLRSPCPAEVANF